MGSQKTLEGGERWMGALLLGLSIVEVVRGPSKKTTPRSD